MNANQAAPTTLSTPSLWHGYRECLDFLFEVSAKPMSHADLGNAIRRLLERVCTLLDVDRAVLVTMDEDHPPVIAHEYRAIGELPVLLGRPAPLAKLWSTNPDSGEPVELSLKAIGPAVSEQTATLSALGYRLRCQGVLLGLLSVHACRTERAWQPDDHAFLKLIAHSLALSLYVVSLTQCTRTTLETLLHDLQPLLKTARRQLGVSDLRMEVEEPCEQLIGRAFPTLTHRERQIASRLHLPNKAIAAALFLSESTVKAHVGRIFAKLESPRRQDALRRLREAFKADV